MGGAEIIAINLAEHCKIKTSQTVEFVIVELFQTKGAYSDEKREELYSKSIRIITLFKGIRRLSLLIAPFKLAHLISKEKPSIIHSHTDLPDFVLSVCFRIISFFNISKPKIIRTIHNTQLWRTHLKIGKFTEKGISNDWIVGISDLTLKAYNDLRNIYNLRPSSKQFIIFNGRAIPEKMPHPFIIDKMKINIAFCGRFEDYKGMDILIPGIVKLNNLYPNVFLFHIIGEGSYKSKIIELSIAYSNVFVYEPVANISDRLYAFDYLFMPSHFEGLVLLSIEASFAGVPVIASNAPGLKETLPQNWPLKFNLNNESELIDIFENIKNDEYDRDALKDMAFKYVSSNFSLEKMTNSYSKIYSEINE